MGRERRLLVGQESVERFKSPYRMEEREGNKAIRISDNRIAWSPWKNSLKFRKSFKFGETGSWAGNFLKA